MSIGPIRAKNIATLTRLQFTDDAIVEFLERYNDWEFGVLDGVHANVMDTLSDFEGDTGNADQVIDLLKRCGFTETGARSIWDRYGCSNGNYTTGSIEYWVSEIIWDKSPPPPASQEALARFGALLDRQQQQQQ